jgi:hypothetical protein
MNPFDQTVENLFANADDRHEEFRRNPITGSGFVRGLDPIRPQKQLAVKALKSRAWFEAQRPSDAAELPLSYEEREAIKMAGVNYIVAVFGRSLEAGDYNTEEHPRFDWYARGVMASPLAPEHVRNDPDLLRRYPPAPLPGLGGGLIWRSQ